MEIDLRTFGAAFAAEERLLVGELLAWRDRLCAATNVQPESMVFLVPPGDLFGMTSLYGSEVLHADVPQPMVAVGVPAALALTRPAG